MARKSEYPRYTEEIPLLRRILEVQSKSRQTARMVEFITNFAEQVPNVEYYVKDQNIYITKGETQWYPCIVAHTDTVHAIIPDEDYTVQFTEGVYFGYDRHRDCLTGVGGDDKVGIYIALQALLDFDHIKMAFFRDEEIGCLGADNADKDFFKNVRYILECDRRGNDDFVRDINGPLSSKAFQRAVKPLLDKHGYKFSSGAMTDVDSLKDQVAVSMANMSCGYYDPHMNKEYVDLYDVERCRALVYDIFTTLEDKRWDHVVRSKSFASYHSYQWGMYGGYDDEWDTSEIYWREINKLYQPLPKDEPKQLPALSQSSKKPTTDSGGILIVKEVFTINNLDDYSDVDVEAWAGKTESGFYCVQGVFNVLVAVSEDQIREAADLPAHFTIVHVMSTAAKLQTRIDLGTKYFESKKEAEDWGMVEGYGIERRFPELEFAAPFVHKKGEAPF